MDWYDLTDEYHGRTLKQQSRLDSLPAEWQCELAAIWRLEADVNNGSYLQFLSNWGRDSYHYASQGLRKIGANRMAAIVDTCQSLVDEQIPPDHMTPKMQRNLFPNAIIDGRDGSRIKDEGSILPDAVVESIQQLSDEFMDYPDDIASAGLKYYEMMAQADLNRDDLT